MRTAIIVSTIMLFSRAAGAESSSPWRADTVIDATEQREFRELVLDLANTDMDELARLVYAMATGAVLDATDDDITTEQLDRWFRVSHRDSFIARAHMALIRRAARSRGAITPRPQVLSEAIRSATDWISAPRARRRLLGSIARMTADDVIDY